MDHGSGHIKLEFKLNHFTPHCLMNRARGIVVNRHILSEGGHWKMLFDDGFFTILTIALYTCTHAHVNITHTQTHAYSTDVETLHCIGHKFRFRFIS